MEEFFTKTRICFGTGSLEFLKNWKAERIFLVADPFLVESGLLEQVTEHLAGREYRIFSSVVPDPPLELVVEGVKEAEAWKPDTILAVGGGSAIDEAKAILYFSGRVAKLKELRFIAVPTTSGTGSEVTSFAVITDKAKRVKYPLVDAGLRPDVAILDPALVKSVPPTVTADTGMDVLTHALEAYVSKRADDFTDALAEKAALTVFRCLVRSFEQPKDEEARAHMHYASCMAGMAFDKASLGLNHAIAHNIGGKFKVPHGRANAILLPHVMNFNAGLTDYRQKTFSETAKKYANLAALAGVSGINIRTSVRNLIQLVEKLQKQLNLPFSFKESGVSIGEYRKQEEAIITGALRDACIASNPRNASGTDIKEILKKAE